MELFLEDFDWVNYDSFKQVVVNSLERAKEQSEVWVGTMISDHIDRDAALLERAMHDGNIPIARMRLRDLQSTVKFAETNQFAIQ